MKKNIVIHIPHSSVYLPSSFYTRLLVDKEKIEKENIFVSDYLVDRLVPSGCDNVLKFNYSRLFCDVERFLDDELEVMSKLGMGAIYTKDSDGNIFIDVDKDYKDDVIVNYYVPFHELIDRAVENVVNDYGKCYFIDLHSFSDEFVLKVLNKGNNPDICIGFEEDYIDEDFLDYTVNFFRGKGYSVAINYPYNGTLIPNICYKNKDIKINSIMIEINKRVYLNNNISINEEKFNKLQGYIKEYFENI